MFWGKKVVEIVSICLVTEGLHYLVKESTDERELSQKRNGITNNEIRNVYLSHPTTI